MIEIHKASNMSVKYNWQHPDWPNFTYQSEGLDKIINEYIKILNNITIFRFNGAQKRKSDLDNCYLIIEY